MAAVDVLHHENSPTYAGVEPATLMLKTSDKSTMPPSRLMLIIMGRKSEILSIPFTYDVNDICCPYPMWCLVMLTAVPQSLGSNPGEGMDVWKCIVPSQQGVILDSCRTKSPLVWLVEEEKRWDALDYPRGVFP
ncbi:hypothetical protein TNCV_3834011 [Trichonephila clavipes]|nr:hypothetical protein TNCV_3834011 [Trichonephila clavipes]